MDSMRGYNLELFLITEKQSWCDPIMCHHKGTTFPEDIKNRDVQIIHQSSIFRKKFTRDSMKVIDILK